MTLFKTSVPFLFLSCSLLCGCGNLLRVSTFNQTKPQGVPFFVKHGVCVQQSVYANPYWRLTLTYSISGGTPVIQTFVISEKGHGAQEFSNLLAILTKKDPGPGAEPIQDALEKLKAKYEYDPWANLNGERLLSNTDSLSVEVDYETKFSINQRTPFSGSSQADFKLGADGTLNEASGQSQDNTFATVISALPISSLITSAAGTAPKAGAAQNKEDVAAQFTLNQEQRYIKIVNSKTLPLPATGFCDVPTPLRATDANVAFAVTDVGSTDTVEAGTQDKNTDTISVSGTIKLPKTISPVAPASNPADAQKPAGNGAASTQGQSPTTIKKKK